MVTFATWLSSVNTNKLQDFKKVSLHQKKKMSTRDNSMTFFGAVPKPLTFETKRTPERATLSNPPLESEEEDLTRKLTRSSNENIKLITYEITFDKLELAQRDLAIPFDFLAFFHRKTDKNTAANNLQYPSFQTIVEKKAKLAEIQLQILYRAEKGQPLTNIPNSLAKFLADLDYAIFVAISHSFMNVFRIWIETIQKNDKRRIFKKFYATENKKRFDLDKMTENLERIFLEGFSLLNKPTLMELGYIDFIHFLQTHSIPFSGPFQSNLNGQEFISIYVISKHHCLRFFNNNKPLFGIFEFEPITKKEKFEPMPQWFFAQPSINNFAINSMLSDFERVSFV